MEIVLYVVIIVCFFIFFSFHEKKEELKSLKEYTRSIEKSLAESQKTLESMSDTNVQLTNTLNQLQNDFDMHRQQSENMVEYLKQNRDSYKYDNTVLIRKNNELESIISHFQKDKNLYKDNLVKIEKQNLELTSINKQLQESNDSYKNELYTAECHFQKDLQFHQNALEKIECQKNEIMNELTLVKKERDDLKEKNESLDVKNSQLIYRFAQIQQQLDKYKKCNDDRAEFLNTFLSSDNLKCFPYIASLIADYKTLDLQYDINSLTYGNSKTREKKVSSLIEIKKQLKDTIMQYKNIEYQLDYLKVLYPGIDDVLETSYSDLTINELSDIDTDPVRNYLSNEEFHSLSITARNQLALDRYIESHSKSKWQIGRDYELYVGYIYSNRGYTVDYFGSYMGLEDLGRDLIAKRGNEIVIIQCKYWSKDKLIYEKHIAQLYGTYISYCIENNVSKDNVYPVFFSSTSLSEQAKKFCDFLGVTYNENFPLGNFPRIKCNVGKDEYGDKTYIYHLPMDQQYDKVKICNQDECMAFTVQEAESKGFRRAYRWHNN